jgi:hypothetical protein
MNHPHLLHLAVQGQGLVDSQPEVDVPRLPCPLAALSGARVPRAHTGGLGGLVQGRVGRQRQPSYAGQVVQLLHCG